MMGNDVEARERRKSPRIQARLHCTVRRGSDRFRARILDLSDGGMCLMSPIELHRGEHLEIQLEIPGQHAVDVEATAWHVRALESSDGRRTWSVGTMLTKSGRDYDRLIPNEGRCEFADDDEVTQEFAEHEIQVYRVVVQAIIQPPTRVLTIGAASEEEARALASEDLGEDWSVVDIIAT